MYTDNSGIKDWGGGAQAREGQCGKRGTCVIFQQQRFFLINKLSLKKKKTHMG